MEETKSQVRKVTTKGEMRVSKVYVAEFQKPGTKTAELRQKVTNTSYYPSKKISNDLQDNPFGLAEFGFEEQEFKNSTDRVAFINVPEIISSTDDVLAKLPSTATIYRILSNHPILTEDQAYSIEAGLKTLNDYADKQVARYGKDHADAGKIILDKNGKPQYRSLFYSSTAKEDIDNRTEEPTDFYASPKIKAEVFGTAEVITGQELG